MKKIYLILGIFAMLVATPFVLAETMTISSDDTMEWSADGTYWSSAFETWVHPAWPLINGAKWIWRTAQTDPADEYANVPDGGWYFRKTFNIPECVNEVDLEGTITAAADNSYEMWFNGVYVDGRGTMDKNGPDAQSWRLKTSADLTGLTTGKNEISFRALNYFSTGSYSSNPAGLIFQINLTLPEDEDEDGFCNVDLCPGTNADGISEELGMNRWRWDGDSWETNLPNGKGPKKSYNIEQTQGCSCSQILNWLHENDPEEYGEMEGHWKFGCSSSVMDDFVRLTSD